MTATRILLADDHTMVRRGLRMVLDAQPDLKVVAEAGDGADVIEQGLRADVDLAVLDVSMPKLTGLQAAAELARRRPELRILMLSMHDYEQYLFEALKAGASGYVLKSGADRDLVEACRAAMRGEPFLYPAAVSRLIRDVLARAEEPVDPLTPRELQVVKLIAEAHTSDRRAARDQPAHRGPPSREHPREARHARSRRVDPLRDQARARRALRMGGRPARVGSERPWKDRGVRHRMVAVRILVLWNACRGTSVEDDARWVHEESAKLRDCDQVLDVSLHQVESAALRHPRQWDWCLELRVGASAAGVVVRHPTCAAFLADLRLLGTRPSVLVLPEMD